VISHKRTCALRFNKLFGIEIFLFLKVDSYVSKMKKFKAKDRNSIEVRLGRGRLRYGSSG
jgi:hypothetical protein